MVDVGDDARFRICAGAVTAWSTILPMEPLVEFGLGAAPGRNPVASQHNREPVAQNETPGVASGGSLCSAFRPLVSPSAWARVVVDPK